MKRTFLLITLGATVLAALAGVVQSRLGFSPAVLLALRWTALAAFVCYCAARRSLTFSILAGMLAGAELGYDAPGVVLHLAVDPAC